MNHRAIARCSALLQHEARLAARAREKRTIWRYETEDELRASRSITRHHRAFSDLSWNIDATEQGIRSDNRRGKRSRQASSSSHDGAAELRAFVESRDQGSQEQTIDYKCTTRDDTAAITGERARESIQNALNARTTKEVREAIAQALAQHAVDWRQQAVLPREHLFTLDYKAVLPLALSREEPDLAVRCITAAAHRGDAAFLKAFSNEDFTRILLLLRPQTFLRELIDVHYHLSDATVNNFGLVPLETIGMEYERIVMNLLTIRRCTHTLRVIDFEIVLEAAQELHLAALGEHAWVTLTATIEASDERDQSNIRFTIKPSVKCYNGYVGARLYPTPLGAKSRQKDRVTPLSHDERNGDAWQNFFNTRVSVENKVDFTNQTYSDMQARGLFPDALSYAHMITACGLDGQIASVASILKVVYHVDVDYLARSVGRERAPRPLSRDDPLYPSEQFLYAVTRAYCVNNDLTTALRLLYYISKSYQIPIRQKQWALMLEWSYVLGIWRSEREREAGKAQGQVDSLTFEAMWHNLRAPPHGIQPTIGMYDYAIRAAYDNHQRRAPDDPLSQNFALEAMEEADELLQTLRGVRTERWEHLNALLSAEESNAEVKWGCEHAARQWELAHLECINAEHHMGRWFFYYLQATSVYAKGDFSACATAVKLPKMIQRWGQYAASNVIEYDMPTGHVELWYESPEEQEVTRARLQNAAIAQEEALRKVPRLIDDCWITNHSSYERCLFNHFPHNRKLNPWLHKSERGLRRPEQSMELPLAPWSQCI